MPKVSQNKFIAFVSTVAVWAEGTGVNPSLLIWSLALTSSNFSYFMDPFIKQEIRNLKIYLKSCRILFCELDWNKENKVRENGEKDEDRK